MAMPMKPSRNSSDRAVKMMTAPFCRLRWCEEWVIVVQQNAPLCKTCPCGGRLVLATPAPTNAAANVDDIGHRGRLLEAVLVTNN